MRMISESDRTVLGRGLGSWSDFLRGGMMSKVGGGTRRGGNFQSNWPPYVVATVHLNKIGDDRDISLRTFISHAPI